MPLVGCPCRHVEHLVNDIVDDTEEVPGKLDLDSRDSSLPPPPGDQAFDAGFSFKSGMPFTWSTAPGQGAKDTHPQHISEYCVGNGLSLDPSCDMWYKNSELQR